MSNQLLISKPLISYFIFLVFKKTLLVTLALVLVAVSADVSHLAGRYLPPNFQMQNNHQGMMMMQHHKQQPSNERVETTIEQHEVIELPTQVEIVKSGQPIYGVQQQQPIEMLRMAQNHEERMAEINTRYLPPTQEIENLQPPQVPYEMPMKEFLPPVEDTTTTDMPSTTTMMPPTTTYNSQMEGETTTEQQFTQEQINNYAMTTTQEPAYETTTATPAMPENQYLPPMAMPQNHYLPPMSMNVMLPPPEPMPQPTYQQYQEQMMREEQMQRMYRDQEMQEMMNAIAEMEQQQMFALEPNMQQQQPQPQQMQPVAPVEPGHILREDGYHYKTAADDARRLRYRN